MQTQRCADIMDAAGNNATSGQSQDQSSRRPEGEQNRFLRLQQAALNGDWATAKGIFDRHSGDICAKISTEEETALHIAVAAEQTDFVRKLVNLMIEENLPLGQKNVEENTALCLAAISGNVEIAKVMLKKNENLTSIRGKRDMFPIHMAALVGHKEMVRYLYQFLHHDLEAADCIELLSSMIDIDLYDLAFDFVQTHRDLVRISDEKIEDALLALARKDSLLSKSWPGDWKGCITMCFKGNCSRSSQQKSAHQLVENLLELVLKLPNNKVQELLKGPLFAAAALGNVDFLLILIRSYPDLIWEYDQEGRYLFHVAVLNRHESVFNLIHGLGAYKHLIAISKDEQKMSMLNLAARLPPSNRLQTVSGAALQMQRELLWFEAVEKIVPHSYSKEKDSEFEGKVPREVFSKTHEDLRKEGQEWMKETANSSMLVAALIATVVFAAAFTVPGGSNGDTGAPILRSKTSFTVFMVSDAAALFSSSTSIMIFSSILTSRYAEQDFRFWLPLKLMLGLLALFLSIITMLIAFTVTIFLIYNHSYAWIRVLIVVLASITVISFALLHIRLLIDTISSIFSSMFLFRPSRHSLYRKLG